MLGLIVLRGMSQNGESDWIQSPPLPVAADEARLLALLKAHHRGGLSSAELHDRGIAAPAHAIYMLQLAGYEVGPAPVGLDGGRPESAFRLHADLRAHQWRPAAASHQSTAL